MLSAPGTGAPPESQSPITTSGSSPAERAARRVYMGSIAKVAGRLAAEDGQASRHENVRPFLLERASTGAGKADTSQGAASAIERLPELDIGSFL